MSKTELPSGMTPVTTEETSGDNNGRIRLDELDAGELIAGEVVTVLEDQGDYDSREYRVLTGQGELVRFYGCASINEQWTFGAECEEGARIGFFFHGKEENDDGHEEYQFTVGQMTEEAATESDY